MKTQGLEQETEIATRKKKEDKVPGDRKARLTDKPEQVNEP